MSELRTEMKEFVKGVLQEEEIYSVVGTVEKVDESKRTCTVKPSDDSPDLFNVRLQSFESNDNGLVLIPKKDSKVIVTFMNNSIGFVSMCSELEKVLLDCDEVTINGGDNDGLVIVGELTKKINALENKLNSLITNYKTHVHPVSGSTAGAITPPPPITNISPTTQQSDIENTKVKH